MKEEYQDVLVALVLVLAVTFVIAAGLVYIARLL